MTLSRLINLEGILRECMETWARENPEDLLILDQNVKRMRQSSNHSLAGLSLERTMLHKGEIPVKLHHLIQSKTHRDWIHDREIRNLFFSLFRVGCVNRLSESKK